ncbi:MAG TPA: hypothetical protein VIY29_01190 [Ktedonobacteraceae bacterium]
MIFNDFDPLDVDVDVDVDVVEVLPQAATSKARKTTMIGANAR